MYNVEYVNKLHEKVNKLVEYGKTLGVEVFVDYDGEQEYEAGCFQVWVSNLED